MTLPQDNARPAGLDQFKTWIRQVVLYSKTTSSFSLERLEERTEGPEKDIYSMKWEVLKQCQLKTQENPENGFYWFTLGCAHLDLYHYIQANVPFKTALQKDPLNPDFNLYYGLCLLLQERYEESLKPLYQVLEIKNWEAPNKLAAAILLSLACIKSGQLDKAIQLLETEAPPSYPKNMEESEELGWSYAHLFYLLGMAYKEKGRYAKAIEYFQQACIWEPTGSHIYLQLGFIYSYQDVHLEAIAAFQKAAAFHPNQLVIYTNLASSCMTAEKYHQAIEAYIEAIRLNPEDPYFYLQLGHAYFQINDFENAIESLKQCIAKDLNCQEAYRFLTQCYEKIGNKALAEKASFKADKLSFLKNINFDLARSLAEEENQPSPQKGTQLSTKEILMQFLAGFIILGTGILLMDQFELIPGSAFNPDYVPQNIANNPGLLCAEHDLSLGSQKLIFACHTAIQQEPQHVYYYYSLGWIGLQFQKYEHAVYAYEKLSLIQPLDTVPLVNLGKIYMIQKKYPEALVKLEQALAMLDKNQPHPVSPNTPNISQGDKGIVYGLIGEVYQRQEKYSNAIRAYENALKETPSERISKALKECQKKLNL
ncbi:MAG: tetratricopeptide repeat protein [Cyanobacteria bacterium]|nr:tetratricopeptide repeat protein [Cyanobacteriota bacterium]